MRKLFVLLFAVMVVSGLHAQQKTDLPNITVKDLNGKDVNVASLLSKNNAASLAASAKKGFSAGSPVVLTFWATWCGPCIKEHNALDEVYDDWQKETGVKIYAVSIDDSRTTAKVKPFVEGKGWDFEILLDPNGDLKRAMNVNNPPHTFLFDGNGNMVYQHTGYFDGSEEELYEEILKLKK